MNPYRCENCTKEDCWYFKMRDDSRTIKDKYGELLTPRSFTWEKGCASHSSHQSERDKFLKRMLECISQYEMLPNGMDFVIEDLLAELRQAGEP